MDNRWADLSYTFVDMCDNGWGWFNTHNRVLKVEDTEGVIALNSAGTPVAGCVFDNWTPNSVQVHLTILDPMVLRAGFMDLCYHKAFRDGRQLVIGLVPSNNEKSIKFNKHMGYEEVCRLDDSFSPGVGCVIMRLRKEDYNCLGEKTDGQA